ncbi:FMN-binding protein [Clostridium carnis]
MKSRKVLGLVAVAALAATVFVGCGKKEDAAKYKDGKYEATSAADERGYKGTIAIEVKDGKISTVKYDEVKEDGTAKSTDKEYNKLMKEKVKANPEEAFPALEKALVDKQDPSTVDAVTNATKSSDAFKDLAAKALEKAK